MNAKQIKESFIESLYTLCNSRGDYIKQVNDREYRTRCPFCGDSQSNLNTGHMYIRVGLDDNLPILFNCFKCQSHGVVNSEFLMTIGMEDNDLNSNISMMNKNADSIGSEQYFTNTESILYFDYKLPEVKRNKKIEYIEKRLGIHLSDDDMKKFKIITSLKEFFILNKIKELLVPVEIANNIEENYVGFLTLGNSYILFRDITNTQKYHWIKYPITQESKKSKAVYFIENQVDIFSKEIIEINLAEGIMDIISAAKNLGTDNSTNINVGVCGKYYLGALQPLIDMGYIGDNVNINIFADNDEKFNDSKNNQPITVETFKRTFHSIQYLFGKITVDYNTIDKDIGVQKDRIHLQEYVIYNSNEKETE